MRLWTITIAVLLALLPWRPGQAQPAARNVVVITIDGLRWQEFFTGADREYFSGAADSRIDSNDKVPNPNITVLEWLNGRPGFQGRVAAFGSWDVLPPGVAPRGVRQSITATTSQVAATIAALVGEDFRAAVPTAAPPLPFAK